MLKMIKFIWGVAFLTLCSPLHCRFLVTPHDTAMHDPPVPMYIVTTKFLVMNIAEANTNGC